VQFEPRVLREPGLSPVRRRGRRPAAPWPKLSDTSSAACGGSAAALVLATQKFVANCRAALTGPLECCIAGADGQPWPYRSAWAGGVPTRNSRRLVARLPSFGVMRWSRAAGETAHPRPFSTVTSRSRRASPTPARAAPALAGLATADVCRVLTTPGFGACCRQPSFRHRAGARPRPRRCTAGLPSKREPRATKRAPISVVAALAQSQKSHSKVPVVDLSACHVKQRLSGPCPCARTLLRRARSASSSRLPDFTRACCRPGNRVSAVYVLGEVPATIGVPLNVPREMCAATRTLRPVDGELVAGLEIGSRYRHVLATSRARRFVDCARQGSVPTARGPRPGQRSRPPPAASHFAPDSARLSPPGSRHQLPAEAVGRVLTPPLTRRPQAQSGRLAPSH